ncbi:MAG: molybdopterin converting factor subunit 1 [Thermoplasmata archaeon]|nr:molybdopterin converting factor subunit 1 [Thermoplasmata archaeon]
MEVKITFFGRFREITGENETTLEIKKDLTLKEILEIILRKYPKLKEEKNNMLFSVNHRYASLETIVRDGDEIAVFPPVGGG